jgi:hypothetical protein
LNSDAALRSLSARFPDWEQFKDEIAQEISAHPERYPEDGFGTPDKIEGQIEAAYHMTKGQWTAEAPSRRFAEIMQAGSIGSRIRPPTSSRGRGSLSLPATCCMIVSMAADREWQRIVTHFRDAFFRRNPSPPQPHLEGFLDSLEGTLREALGDATIDFVDLVEGKQQEDEDDFGSALIFAGQQFHRLRVRNEELQVVVIGELVAGRYREEIQLADGQIVQTTIKYEHSRLEERNEAPLVFKFTPNEAQRFAFVRRGLRVWGGRTIAGPSSETRPNPEAPPSR